MMRNNLALPLALIAATGVVLIASAYLRASELYGPTDDASITAQVEATLLFSPSTGPLKAKVETTNGVVTLAGIVWNTAEKTLVTKLVKEIPGVSRVINNMTIAAPAASEH